MVEFYKYQGTGNDFIIIDDRAGNFDINTTKIADLCDRKFGVGADGLMLLQKADDYDFRMVYYNADGHESTMCGNGGRCIVAFAKVLGIIKDEAFFIAVDGPHKARIEDSQIALEMIDVDTITSFDKDFVLNTGSPHYVKFVEDLILLDVAKEGKKIRNLSKFKSEGINVNFAEFDDGRLVVRTYERGVEDETLSCGTGVTAAAICFSAANNQIQHIPISTLGGRLQVVLNWHEESVKNIWLKGPATFVFKGQIIQ